MLASQLLTPPFSRLLATLASRLLRAISRLLTVLASRLVLANSRLEAVLASRLVLTKSLVLLITLASRLFSSGSLQIKASSSESSFRSNL
jgi:hypothetical protein